MERAPDDEIAEIADDELVAQALAADPDQRADPDARPMTPSSAALLGLLPEWYMPAPLAAGRARRVLLGGLVLALVVVNGAGLCVTFGFPEIAW